jgi:hypothetical protein
MTKEFDPLEISAQDKTRAEEAEVQRLKREREVADFRWLMANAEGRRFVWRLLAQAGMFRTSFSSNGLEFGRNEGNKNMGYMLISEIHESCPERYHQMVKENRQDGNRSDGTTKR